MDIMFWVWLSVLIVTAIIEFATMEIVSIWFTFGAVVPLILAATKVVSWEIQVVIFVVLSAVLIVSLRQVTKKFLLRNAEGKTNLDAIIGQKYRMISRTDFETVGSLKVNDVVWSAVGENQETIEKDEIVEIVKIKGNKLIVKKASKEKLEEKTKIKKNDKKPLENKEKFENLESAEEKISKPTAEKTSTKKRTNSSENKKNVAEKSEKISISNKKSANFGKTTKNTSAKSTKTIPNSKNSSQKSKNLNKNAKKSTKKSDK